MARHYLPISTLNLTHTFYADGVCSDFDIQPTARSLSTMKGYRMQWGTKNRKRPSSYELLQESADGITALLPVGDGLDLSFAMRLLKPTLANFSSLPACQNNEIYVFQNSGGTGTLVLRVMELVGGGVQIDGMSLGQQLTVTPPRGEASFTVDAKENGGGYSALAPLSGRAPGVYQLDWPVGQTKQVYYDPELYGKGYFGVLNLRVGGGHSLEGSYGYEFIARELKWKYFLMLRGDHTGYDYDITASGLDFDPYDSVDWEDGDPGNAMIASAGASGSVTAFISRDDIAYADVVRSFIGLIRTGIGPTLTVVQHLPNPSLGSATGAVIVTVEEPLS